MLEGVRCDSTPPENTARVLVSLDRFCVSMREDNPNTTVSEATRRKRAKVPHQRKPPEPFEVNGRMAYVASVTLYDEMNEALGTFRYAAPHDADPAELVAQVRADIEWVRAHGPQREVDVCLDGAKDLWKVMLTGLEGLEGPALHSVVDWYHFWERVKPELVKLWDEQEAAKWRRRLGSDSEGIQGLLEAMWERVAQLHSQCVYDDVERFEKYVKERAGLFDYASQRADERAEGSGSVESSCKQVGQRMRRSGQQWRPDGAEGRLALRATFCSGPAHDLGLPEMERWPLAWERFAQRFRPCISFPQGGQP